MAEPHALTAAAAAAAIAAGTLRSEALVASCLERIAERDDEVRAWRHVDPSAARDAAREADRRIEWAGGPAGPLEGLPIGVKDVIDVAGMPTTHNSSIYQGFMPAMDAECVRVARACGAVILGKTDTVEFAAGGRKAATRNPHDTARTPGGSSSGSAAATGDRQVPISFGTQTAGSLIRPASYNGIYALKPTWGAVAWPGTKQLAPSLDTLGWYGREVADLKLMARAFRLRGLADLAPPELSSLRIGLCRTPFADRCDPTAIAALEAAAARLAAAGAEIRDLDLPDGSAALEAHHATVMFAEAGPHLLGEWLENGHRLAPDLAERVEKQEGVPPAQLIAALDAASDGRRAVEAMFGPELDVILCPAALGEAPIGVDSMGAWTMNAFWTLLHLPCLAIPAGLGPAGMPIGIQLVGPRYDESRLLALAAACAPYIDV